MQQVLTDIINFNQNRFVLRVEHIVFCVRTFSVVLKTKFPKAQYQDIILPTFFVQSFRQVKYVKAKTTIPDTREKEDFWLYSSTQSLFSMRFVFLLVELYDVSTLRPILCLSYQGDNDKTYNLTYLMNWAIAFSWLIHWF